MLDPYLAIASKRDERHYTDAPVDEDVRQRILDAGRLTGQIWITVVATGLGNPRRRPLVGSGAFVNGWRGDEPPRPPSFLTE